MDCRKRFTSNCGDHARPLGELTSEDIVGNTFVARLVLASELGGRHVEHDCVARHPVALGHDPPLLALDGIGAERIDDRRQLAPESALDDVVEHGERIGRRTQVVLALTHQRPEPVAGNDMIGEVFVGPPRLARPRRPYEHHEAGRWQLDQTQRSSSWTATTMASGFSWGRL